MKLQIYIINKTAAGLIPWWRRNEWSEADGHSVLASAVSSGVVLERDFDLPDHKEFVSLLERPALPSLG